ncbi:MAG: Ger(x)C family spore germination protein [Clostridia bacterium]|nr:Ger(x)C family spore germination protein [Clostridia bacterium]
MKEAGKKILLLFILLTLSVSLSGCMPEHSKRELNSIAIVMGLGLDKVTKENQIPFEKGDLHVTAQVVRTSSLSGGGSKSSGGASNSADAMYWNLEMAGDDIFPMLRGSVKQSNRNLYISHSQVIVFGEDLAREGLAPFMDYFFREREMRYNVLLAVSEKPAKELLRIAPSLETLPAQEIAKLLKIQAKSAEAPTVSLFDFAVDMKSGRKAAVIPLINGKPSGEEEETVYVDGCAVFDRWTMVGKLNATQTRGFLWTAGDIQSTVLTVPVEDTRFSLTVTGKKGKMHVDFNPDAGYEGIYVSFQVAVDAVVGHIDGIYDLHQKDGLEKIQQRCAREIAAEICDAIGKSRELESDIFGVSEYLSRHEPKLWKKIEGEWDAYFSGITYEVSVKANVRRTGSLVDPVLKEGVQYD